jgi:hypothetical protein
MQYFDPLLPVVRKCSWRLVGLVRGFASTLRRLKATGAKVIVVRDQTFASFSRPECLLGEGGGPETCTYPAAYRLPRAFEFHAARRVGVRTIDPEPVFCPQRQGRPVSGRILVFRDRYHLSATFARTMRS